MSVPGTATNKVSCATIPKRYDEEAPSILSMPISVARSSIAEYVLNINETRIETKHTPHSPTRNA